MLITVGHRWLVKYAEDCGLCGVLSNQYMQSSQTMQCNQCSIVKHAGDCGLCGMLSSQYMQSSQRSLVKHTEDCGLCGMLSNRYMLSTQSRQSSQRSQ